MSNIYTATQIAEMALQQCGEFPVTETAAQEEPLRRALFWLDVVLAEEAGAGRRFYLTPDTISFTLTNGTTEYELDAAFGDDLPPNGIQFPKLAWIEVEGRRYPVTIAKRDTFEKVMNATDTGRPCMIYIDRLQSNSKLRIYPTPHEDDTTEYELHMVVQTFAPNMAPAGVSGIVPLSTIVHEFRVSWQGYIIDRLAIRLGDGALRPVPPGRLERWERRAERVLKQLEAYENREHDTQPPICEAWGE